MKQMLNTAVRNAYLTMEEIKELLLKIAIISNNRRLTYVDDDIKQPILTPNALIHGQKANIPDFEVEDNPDIRK